MHGLYTANAAADLHISIAWSHGQSAGYPFSWVRVGTDLSLQCFLFSYMHGTRVVTGLEYMGWNGGMNNGILFTAELEGATLHARDH